MNKQKFNQIVQDQSRVGEKELIELAELSNDYPYSQVIHILVAKGSHDLKLQNAASKLHKAAFYVSDRGILKRVITSTSSAKTRQSSSKSKPSEKAKVSTTPGRKQAKPTAPKLAADRQDGASTKTTRKEPTQSTKVVPKKVESKPYDTLESYDIKPADQEKVVKVAVDEKPLSEQVLESIAALKKARELAQLASEPVVTEEEPKTAPPKPTKRPAKPKTGSSSKADINKTTSKTTRKATTKSSASRKKSATTAAKAKADQNKVDKQESVAKDVVVEKKPTSKKSTKTTASKAKAKASKASKKPSAKSKDTQATEEPKTSKKKTSNKDEVPTKKYLKSIKKSKPKETGVGDRQKEQIEIINKFIKKGGIKKPDNPNDMSVGGQDLSSHSVEFHENLVSENLAKIFISQKQYDKAVDIYKKLIWKFPQKKSYFAAQIEELKKL